MKKIVPIIMGSEKDYGYASEIGEPIKQSGADVHYRVGSAHKTPAHVLEILKDYAWDTEAQIVYVTVAGRSNGLGGMVAANTSRPVITAPPEGSNFFLDLPSSLRMPSDVPLMTAPNSRAAAGTVKKIFDLYAENFHPYVFVGSDSYACCTEITTKKLKELKIEAKTEKLTYPAIEISFNRIPGKVNVANMPRPYILCSNAWVDDLSLLHNLFKPYEGGDYVFVSDCANAALAAAAIVAGVDLELRGRLETYYKGVRQKIIDADSKLRGGE